MSKIASQPNDENDDAVLQSAADILESAVANSLIEMQLTKAIRVGSMLRLWREMMSHNGDVHAGTPFSEAWIESAAMDIFHSFFPPFQLPDPEIYDDDDD